MRVLHTADWHLGQRFNGYDRHDEHQCFLDWLLQVLEEEQVEVLIVAGDIFDTANPSASAQEQYYNFLARLSKSYCKDVVVVAGNHDNPHLLNAPRAILKTLNIHVIGSVTEDANDQCIHLPSASTTRLVVAAVPYLRDTDIRRSALGESGAEQEHRVRQGIAEHYSRLAASIRHHRAANVPVLATGHLFAQGCTASEGSERMIHVGTLGQVAADAFTDAFDYVALGHLHRHQIVGEQEHIRYSGSPIPLSFSEVEYSHRVLLLDFEGAQKPQVTALPVPCTRRLLRVTGGLDEVMQELRAWANEGFSQPAWAEVTVVGEESPIRVNDELDTLSDALKEKLVIVSRRIPGKYAALSGDATPARPTEDILKYPSKVFEKLLDAKGYPADDPQRENLLRAFAELLSLEDTLEAE